MIGGFEIPIVCEVSLHDIDACFVEQQGHSNALVERMLFGIMPSVTRSPVRGRVTVPIMREIMSRSCCSSMYKPCLH
jgi:hypothetical protein